MHFPMILRWIVYVDPKPPKGALTLQAQLMDENGFH